MADLSEVNKLNEITKEMVRKVMELRTAGTCAWCGGHNRELLVQTWQIGGELRIGWVCEKCLEEVTGDA